MEFRQLAIDCAFWFSMELNDVNSHSKLSNDKGKH